MGHNKRKMKRQLDSYVSVHGEVAVLFEQC